MPNNLRDIRELQSDKDAYAEELYRRWTGLMSYRYIGRNHGTMNLGEIDNTVVIRRDLRDGAGGILAATLAISAPEGCQTDLVVVPNPVIASIQYLDPGVDVKKIEVVGSECIHQGRQMSYGRSIIVDADNPDRVLALVHGQGAAIGEVPEGLDRMDVSGTELNIEDSPDLPPLWDAFGAFKRGDGFWVMPELRLETASPDSALHIGPQHVLLETAAIDIAADLAGTRKLHMNSWHVMFLARAKVGAFRAEGTAYLAGPNKVGVSVMLHDEGNNDRNVSAASAVFDIVS